MQNIQDLKERVDCRQIVAQDLGKPVSKSSKCSSYKCPFHNERHGASLAVYADGWKCFGACDTNGDVIDWLTEYRRYSKKEAIDFLGGNMSDTPISHRQKPAQAVKDTPYDLHQDYAALTDPAWQRSAWDYVYRCQDALFSPVGAAKRDYLQERGLTLDVIENFALGFNPTGYSAMWGETEVYCHAGVTIAWIIEQTIYKVNHRLFEGDVKYRQIKGGANALYGAGYLFPGCDAIMVEGEFDALILWSQVPDIVQRGLIPVATGSVGGARTMRWVSRLAACQRVLLSFDNDEPDKNGNRAGDKASAYWLQELGDIARRYPPTEHDVTDMWRVNSQMNFRGWLTWLHDDLEQEYTAWLGQF